MDGMRILLIAVAGLLPTPSARRGIAPHHARDEDARSTVSAPPRLRDLRGSAVAARWRTPHLPFRRGPGVHPCAADAAPAHRSRADDMVVCGIGDLRRPGSAVRGACSA